MQNLKNKIKVILPVLVLAFVFISCSQKQNKNTNIQGIDIADFDTTVIPQNNLFEFANGGWIKNNPIPPSERYWGVYSVLQNDNYKKLKKVMEEAAENNNAEKGSNQQKLGDFYFSGMDTVSIEKEGINPLKHEFDRINNIKNTRDLINVITLYQTYRVSPLFDFYVEQDLKNSEQQVPYLSQGGLGLPDRDYYLKTDSESVKIRKEYIQHIANMFKLLGDQSETAENEAQNIMNLETKLAKVSLTNIQQRDPYAVYHKYTLQELNKLTPEFNWTNYFDKIGAKNVDYVIVDNADFFKLVNNELKNTSLNDWKNYLRWNLISTFANDLNSKFVNEHFHFYGTVLNGITQIKPRWKRIIQAADRSIGEILGQEYVKENFTPETKARCLKLVNNLFKVFGERIKNLEWMSPETKEKALHKLNTMVKKIGYPDKWRDYSKLEIDRGPFVLNQLRANIFRFNYMLNKIGKPVDKTEWGMTPQTVNAYYNPSMNEVVFPAGILQPPLFDPNADDAVNYGETGATIGHEMTHGFDDEGRQFDAEGNLKDWWTKSDAEQFKKRAEVMIKQFDNYVVLDSLHVNGKLTLGENIADLGGLIIAHEAFKLTDEYKSNKKIGGYTPDQRFFIAYAQSWKGHTRNAALRTQVLTDPHAPDFLRANSPVSNMASFYKAFDVKQNDKMYIPDSLRVNIW